MKILALCLISILLISCGENKNTGQEEVNSYKGIDEGYIEIGDEGEFSSSEGQVIEGQVDENSIESSSENPLSI